MLMISSDVKVDILLNIRKHLKQSNCTFNKAGRKHLLIRYNKPVLVMDSYSAGLYSAICQTSIIMGCIL